MAWTTTKLRDTDYEALLYCEASGAESATVAVDASTLSGHVSSPVLNIAGIKCNPAAAATSVQVHFDADTDDDSLKFYGSASYGYTDGTKFSIANPKSTGVTGDIRLTSSAAVGILLHVKKVSGYTNSQ